MKKSAFIVAFATLFLLAACKPDAPQDPNNIDVDLVILNNGAWGHNDANIANYKSDTKELQRQIFKTVNNKALGDLGQDMIKVGERYYIAVCGSKVVYECNPNMEVIREYVALHSDGYALSPRCLAEANGNVFVTYQEGYLGYLSILSDGNPSVSVKKVGPNPEGIAIAQGHIFISESGAYVKDEDGKSIYNNTVSIYSLNNWTAWEETVTVNTNPQLLCASEDGNFIYVNSFGDYGMIPSMLQAINVNTLEVLDIDVPNVSTMAMGSGNRLMLLCGGYDSDWNPLPGSVTCVDASSAKVIGKFSDTAVPQAYSISADKESGYVFVGTSDYVSEGSVSVFDGNGKFLGSTGCGGLNPQKVLILR